MDTYKVLLYYYFTTVNAPDELIKAHKKFCKDNRILGRIYISEEGINGTIGGTEEQMETYKKHLRSLEGFAGVEFKEDPCEFVPFAKLVCKYRKEIVALHMDEDVNPKNGGNHLKPNEWRQVLEGEEDYVLIDVRNNYESKIGHFEGALKPDLKNFYDFPEWLDNFEWPKDKKVLMYCTGGIRCEKFSVVMKDKGWEDVNQLHGGIINYGHEEGGKHWKGKCFVFDDRLAVPINPESTEPIAECEITGEPADTYLNCANMECNRLFVCSDEGAKTYEGCCSKECMESDKRRPFDPENPFRPFRKWYNYFDKDFKNRQGAQKK